MSADYTVEVLAKGMRVLSLFSEQRPTWRLRDIAATTTIPLPTVYRLVMTLASEAYLEHLPDGAYRPGARVLTLGTAALRGLDPVEIAGPLLQELAAETGEAVNLGVLVGDQVLYLACLRNHDRVTATVQVGSAVPAGQTSIGTLLLAHAGRDEQVLGRGWAEHEDELAFGWQSVAAPVFDAGDRMVAGVNIVVPTGDWSSARVLEELTPALLRTCRRISGLLGHRTSMG